MKADGHDGERAAKRRRALRERADRVLSDRLMIELALLLVPTTALPMAFSFSPFTLSVFEWLNGGIIAVFAIEYGVKLYAAESRWRYFRSPWHLLDLGIVLFAGIELLPWVTWHGGRASPLLRLLRAARVFAVTGRALKRAVPPARRAEAPASAAGVRIRILEEGAPREDVSWEDADASVRDPRETWIDIQRAGVADLDRLASVFRVPPILLRSKLFADAFPGIDYFKDFSVLTLWDVREEHNPSADRPPAVSHETIVVICARDYLATLSTGGNALFEDVSAGDLPLEGESFSVRVLYAILRRQTGEYKALTQRLEQEEAAMEEMPTRSPPSGFLEDTFLLKKNIQQHDYCMRHFAQVLSHLSARRVTLSGIREESLEAYSLLRDEADTLADTTRIVRENLLSLIDLQLNRVSFNLNRVMRFLAVLSCLGLIPAVVGGLLGENLVDQPYNVTIGEVFFLVLALMSLALYIFYRRGWLK